jgi:trimeric autotransporter adhesin
MATYVNDLRLKEIGTGESSGTWGSETNTNLELIGEALGFGTEGITTNADTHTTTIADGSTDPGRAMYLKYTGTLDSACTITIAPNTISRMQFIENGTSGSQNIIISQGTGANVTIPAGDTKAIYLDGAGSGAAVVDAYASLNVVDLKVEDDLTVTDDTTIGGTLGVTGVLSATSLDISGDIDVDGTSNLDIVDIDGAVDMASTLQVDGVATFTSRDIHNGGITIANAGQIGSVGDTDAIAIASDGVVTLTQKLVGTELDISGNIDIDGTTETDVLTINGSQLNYKTFGTSSFMIGDTTTGTIDAANYNTGVGVDVFAALTSGDLNTAIGFSTLTANTTGFNNTAVGNAALQANTTGGQNSALGSRVLPANTEGNGNVGIGEASLFTNTTGDYNIGIGLGALQNSNSDDNIAIGYRAMHNVSSGTDGVAIGSDSLFTVTTGNNNVGIGHHALRLNTASDNTAAGYGALKTNSSGTRNTAVGFSALDAVSTTNDHTAVGYNALTACTSGGANTAVGTAAADAVTSGDDNTAMGNLALSAATTTDENTAIGSGAMRYSTGSTNTAIGKGALGASSNSGDNNTIVGAGAGISLTSASNNTCIGKGAGNNQITGGQNVFVGENARGSATDTNASIAIGYNVVGVGNFYVTLGSGAGSDRIYNQFDTNASWTRVSDLRYKEEIANNTDCGLNFINDLRPVTYKFKPKANIDNTLPDYDASKTSRNTEKKMYGLIAQEVKQAMDDNNITDFAGWDETAEGIQGISQEMFIHPLIKAVQELTALNAALTTRIEALEG